MSNLTTLVAKLLLPSRNTAARNSEKDRLQERAETPVQALLQHPSQS